MQRMTSTITMVAVALAFLSGSASAAYCSGSPDPDAVANDQPIYADDLTLIKTVENGKLYLANANTTQSFYVTHLFGENSYANGYAQGLLLKDETNEFFTAAWKYLESGLVDALPGIFPQWAQEVAANWAMDEALDWTADATAPFTDQDFLDEIKGISDAAGVDYQLMLRIHMLPEATKGDCSMFGAWGSALADPEGLLQLRALDWDMDGPFRDHAAVTVYHKPTSSKDGEAEELNSWANVGFVGFVGSITGMSDQQMAISEIGVSYPDDTFGKESRHGVPFIVLLRDILMKDKSLQDSMDRITDANRTCDLILGVGDGQEAAFRGVEYSASVANIMDDTNMMPANDTWHPQIDNVVYWGMDWLCPNYSEVLSEHITENYGNITAEVAIRDIVARTQTGNLHIAVYDLTANMMYVSFASKSDDETGPTYAYERSYTKLDMAALFAEQAP